ncbi:MAG: NAD-dependent epimerase/dehydratase family protein [Henriciella sp.]
MQTPANRDGARNGRIAITGATGFIGAHLLRRLDDLNYPTSALVRMTPNRVLDMPSSTRLVSGSLSEPEALRDFLSEAQTCLHLAGATKSVSAAGFHRANAVGTFDLASQAAAAGVQHFIYVSSQAARAPALSDYAASKAAGEAALAPFQARMKITIVRPPAVIGPGDPMLQPMFDLIRLGWLPAPAEPRSGARQFAVIAVEDLVKALISIATAPEPQGGLIKPCSIRSTNWRLATEAVSEVQKRRIRRLPIWPGLLRTVGRLSDGLAKLIRRPMPISYGKVQELLAADWTYETALQDAMTLEEIFAACFQEQDEKADAGLES